LNRAISHATARIAAKPARFTIATASKPRPTVSKAMPAIQAKTTLEAKAASDCRPIARMGDASREASAYGQRLRRLGAT
jgi:hypothetical protein